MVVAVLVGLAATLVSVGASGAGVMGSPVALENTLPGSPGWAGRPQAPSAAIEGYLSAASVLPGRVLGLHVSTRPARRYRVVVYRLGWYGGAGARRVVCLPTCGGDEPGLPGSVPPPDLNGEVRLTWPVTDAIAVGSGWVSGYYTADLILTSGPEAGHGSRTDFVVRAPSSGHSQMLVQVPVNTWEAYNPWGGKSVYDFNSTGHRQANHVSFDRPYASDQVQVATWELPAVRFLERGGYDVSYQTDVDTDMLPASLLDHRLVVTVGHGEYWTKEMRDAFTIARDMGTNLMFLGANTGYAQVRYEDAHRTMVAYNSLYDPNPDPSLKTAKFRELTPPRYECELLGIQHQGAGLRWPPGDYTVNDAAISEPWFRGTGFVRGAVVRGVVSVESDSIPGTQSAASSCGHRLTVYFHRELGSDQQGNADAVGYVAPSGARIFSSGSHQFAWGLDDWTWSPSVHNCCLDPRLQRFVGNVLDDLGRPARVERLIVTKRGSRVAIRAVVPADPRIRAVRIVRTTGRGSGERSVPVCEIGRRYCLDVPPLHGSFFYTAVTLDRWSSSAPVSSKRLER